MAGNPRTFRFICIAGCCAILIATIAVGIAAYIGSGSTPAPIAAAKDRADTPADSPQRAQLATAQPEAVEAAPEQPPVEPPAPSQPAPRKKKTPAAPAQAAQQPANPTAQEPMVPLPLAREALAFVGADPDAEQVWIQAINDPTLSPHDRQDLIEDLNEQGFEDPKHLTADDLPIIVSRLMLIEEVGADAMDDVNAAAFAEAYKDLVKMYLRVAGE